MHVGFQEQEELACKSSRGPGPGIVRPDFPLYQDSGFAPVYEAFFLAQRMAVARVLLPLRNRCRGTACLEAGNDGLYKGSAPGGQGSAQSARGLIPVQGIALLGKNVTRIEFQRDSLNSDACFTVPCKDGGV